MASHDVVNAGKIEDYDLANMQVSLLVNLHGNVHEPGNTAPISLDARNAVFAVALLTPRLT